MSSTKAGLEAEELARQYLEAKGYQTLAKNYRYQRSEVDLIMKMGNVIVFVEVKMRSNTAYGNPEDFVDDEKTEHFHHVAEYYCDHLAEEADIRFDIVALLKRGNHYQIEHFEDAFF